MSKKTIKPIALAVSAAFATSMVASGTVNADASPFSMTTLTTGYMLGDDADKKDKESKRGGEKKGEEGKCGGKKKGEEGKCGEGKCGGKADDAEHKCGEGKCGEGKCGEGKCGSA